MNHYQIGLLAIALAMDAFAVAVAAGVTLKALSFRRVFRLAFHFGLFQALMPIMGWSAGQSIRGLIETVAHWIAFGLLSYVGLHMIRAAITQEADALKKDPTKGLTMVMLSIATSIDALAIGLSLSMINISIWMPALIIGLVAGCFTIAGMFIGKQIGGLAKFSHYAEIIGGSVLLIIGFHILWDHF